jgi:hypothetical protein
MKQVLEDVEEGELSSDSEASRCCVLEATYIWQSLLFVLLR